MAPWLLLAIAAAGLVMLGSGANAGLALLALATLLIGGALLWRPGELPILLAMLGYQWLQASVAIFHANWQGADAAAHSAITGSMETAIMLSLIGLVAVAIGMRLGAGAPRRDAAQRVRGLAMALPIRRWLAIYVVAAGIALAAELLAWSVPAMAQLLLAIGTLKWAAYLALIFAAFTLPGASATCWLVPFLFELGLGLGGFFADFRTVLLLTALAAIAAGTRVGLARAMGLASILALAIGLAIVWTAVKGDFRAFVSEGGGSQAVRVDYKTRMEKLAELVAALDADRLAAGADALARRLAYVELFGAVIDYVPRSAPHEGGAIAWDAVSRPLMPRLLFPDKTGIEDTERTNRFTGGMAGASEATSVSLGFMAEAYIDFGPALMMPALLLAGLAYGRLYACFAYDRRAGGLPGMAMATAVLLPGLALESSLTKIVGGVAVAGLVAIAAMRCLMPALTPDLMLRRMR